MESKLSLIIAKINSGEKLAKVDLSNEGLSHFPVELFALSSCLEVLNLGGNNLSSLPLEITSFTKLRVLFFAQNQFTEFPVQLGSMSSLFMVSFKSNKVQYVAPESLSSSISWLILTDNLIEELPGTIGNMKALRKLMLAGNKLRSLPVELSQCKELELLRIAANNLPSLPSWIFELPRLSWFAFAGNPFEAESGIVYAPSSDLTEIPFAELEIGECIGEGASGFVHKAKWTKKDSNTSVPVAVKLFKGETTSDGLPINEMETTEAIGTHAHFISVLGRLHSAPNNQLGLVLPLLDTSPSAYQILGQPPSFDTITRDTFPAGTTFSTAFVRTVLQGIAAAGLHLHTTGTRGRGIVHGDLYAHNILVHQGTLHPLLTDLGAASFKSAFSEVEQLRLEQIEVRAFGCLIDDLLSHLDVQGSEADGTDFTRKLSELRDQCWNENVAARPSFSVLSVALAQM